MVKSYSWEEINKLLADELKSADHIMTFGTIGSCNVEHDIDIIVTKKPNSKTSDFYKEIHILFDKVDDFLKSNYNAKLICLTATYQPVAEYLKIINPNDLVFDVMVYISYPELRKDWDWAISKGEKTDDLLKNQYNIIFGRKEDLSLTAFQMEGKHDNLYIFLYRKDLLYSKLPAGLKLKLMNENFDYIVRKRLNKKRIIARNEGELKAKFYEVCGILDESNL